MKESDVNVGDGASSHHVRTRRCACNIEDDYECHYFCHLDVIWVNTPSKTTIYGLGGALLRQRRSTGRCTCADMGDKACSTFCSFRKVSQKKLFYFTMKLLIDFLPCRAAADKSNRAGDAHGSEREQLSESVIP
uniref:Endothelin-like toxin domain-containing protein n=1 Tax=Oryzias sinensis TaxID=183150 RepID=A0A8C8DAM0_9TELE